MRAILGWALALSVGCASSGPPLRDAGQDARRPFDAGADASEDDAGRGQDSGTDAPADARTDAPSDAAAPSDARADAPISDAGSDAPIDARADSAIDAGARAPTIDGTIGAGEWRGAVSATNATSTDWAGNELRAIHAILRAEGLYVAIDGSFETTGLTPNAIVVYVDRARGTSEGVALSSLTDGASDLDDALSAGFTTPADFRADLGWGTRDLGRASSSPDEQMGWRDFVRGTPSDFFWVLEGMTVCGASACETFLPRTTLDLGMGASRPRTIAIFARIVNRDGTMSPNQTLPPDDPSMPRTVSMVIELSE